MHKYIRTYIHTYIHTYIRTDTHVHTYIHTYIHILAYINTSIHRCIHAYKFINAYACLHAYTQRKRHAHLDVILCIARGLFDSRPRWFPWKTQTVNVRAVLRVIIGQGKFSIGSRLLHYKNEQERLVYLQENGRDQNLNLFKHGSNKLLKTSATTHHDTGENKEKTNFPEDRFWSTLPVLASWFGIAEQLQLPRAKRPAE